MSMDSYVAGRLAQDFINGGLPALGLALARYGAQPCGRCGYHNKHCRCPKPYVPDYQI
jgi:hypothetical protein